ncbi:LAQU0S03e08042g1_1 [Lachancea quebecensis]|uniref:Ubiquinone biosynthesis O-methyltransferase, mitochondrial n=1 Tax=Lachancea quebecensis TaxID=1654605 RepID=A0A0P1KQ20_9SACH|nr:LAQU0S03e08042g1_1 [Lachancea quebecensis]
MIRVLKRTYTKFNPEFLKPVSSGATKSPGGSTAASQDEVLHFTELAPSWWDVSGPQRILHKMNLARMDFIQKTLREQFKAGPDTYVPGFNYKAHLPVHVSRAIEQELDQDVRSQLQKHKYRVLDIGCGGGILTESLARMPFVSNVDGVDLTPECIEVARKHAEKDPAVKNKLNYQVVPLEDVTENYDIVTCMEMLEHVDQPSEILRHAWNRLNRGGVLFLSTINRDPISWFTTIFVAERVIKVVPSGTHHLSKYINSEEIEQWFKDECAGQYQVLDCKGTMYVPLKGWVIHECSGIGNYIMAVKKL